MRGRRIIVRGLTWVAAFVAVGLLVTVIKTIQLRADYHPGTAPPPPEIDTAAVRHLAEAVRIPTVSLDSEGGAAEHFQRLHALMRSHFPRVFEELTVEIVSGHSLLLTWTGQESAGAPIILLGHLDVVPVETGTDKDWAHPPFSGRAADGYIWAGAAWMTRRVSGRSLRQSSGCSAVASRHRKPSISPSDMTRKPAAHGVRCKSPRC